MTSLLFRAKMRPMKRILFWIGGVVVGWIIVANLFGGSNSPAPVVSSQQAISPNTQTQPSPKLAPTPAPAPTPTPQPKQSCPKGYYINSYGNCVKSPIPAPTVPADATAMCRDGTYSFSQHRSGTCSHHGGVAIWL